MSFTNVLNRVMRRSAPPRRRPQTHRNPGPQGRSFVPRLELLEDRTLPSTLTVLNNADSGDGSLRAAIIAAQTGDQIVFEQSLQGQTITLTSGELAIAKSLDIEGPGADQLANPVGNSHGATELTTGFNWYLNTYVRVQFNWEHAWFDDSVQFGSGATGLHKESNALMTRFQIIF